MTSRHEFLAELHQLVMPKVYLEVGVQYGWSLQLASAAEVAIGIDPHPLVAPQGNQVIFTMTSDEYFANLPLYEPREPVDLAFIDGQHLFEYALRDFVNIEAISSPGGVIVFDDVLPRTQGMASRDMCPGDWTGDVWKVWPILKGLRPDLQMLLVDTQPTGTLVVWQLGLSYHRDFAEEIRRWFTITDVPADILLRTHAVDPNLARQTLTNFLWR